MMVSYDFDMGILGKENELRCKNGILRGPSQPPFGGELIQVALSPG